MFEAGTILQFAGIELYLSPLGILYLGTVESERNNK